MKKILVLVAMMAFMASSASAVITGSKHDLSTSGPMGSVGQATSEVCVFCHTPHAGGTQAPLWNRGDGPTITTQYSSSSLNATFSGTSDARLCLSCHDGTTLAGTSLVNPPSDYGVSTGLTLTNANANITRDLSNDHPVGFAFNAALRTADNNGLKDPTTAAVAALLFSGQVWCSSCHDVHDNTTAAPFLRMSNANSDLCITCHAK